MRYHVVIGTSTKSWALGIEYAKRQTKAGHSVILYDFSSLFTLLPRTLKCILLERGLSDALNISFVRMSKFSILYFDSIIHTFRTMYYFVTHQKLDDSLSASLTNFQIEVIRARISQTMGTKYFEFSTVPLYHLGKQIFRTLLASKSVLQLNLSPSEDSLALYNGREPIEAVWIRQFKDLKCGVEIFERASTDSKFAIFEVSPHFHPEWWRMIERFDQEHQTQSTEDIMCDQTYLRNKLLGFDSYLGEKWSQYYVGETESAVVEGNYVIFYSTSSHEYSPIAEFNSSLGFSDQFESVRMLSKICKSLEIKLVIRRHPNSLSPLDRKDYEKKEWCQLADENTIIFDPNSKVDSHTLARKAHVCFVWRSGIGVETIALGVPTYAMGTAKWATEAHFRTWSESDIIHAIENPKPANIKLLSRYISFMARGGENLLYFKTINRMFAVELSGRRVYRKSFDRVRAKWKVMWRRNQLARKV